MVTTADSRTVRPDRPISAASIGTSFNGKITDDPAYLIDYLKMPYRILCNDVLRECSKLGPGLVSGLFCCAPLHKIRYGVYLKSSLVHHYQNAKDWNL